MNISVSGLSVTRQAQTVLEDIDLDLSSGQIVGLLGQTARANQRRYAVLPGCFHTTVNASRLMARRLA